MTGSVPRVVVVAGHRLPPTGLVDDLAQLKAIGADVTLVTVPEPSEPVRAAVDRVLRVGARNEPPPPAERPPLPRLVVRKAQLELQRVRRQARRGYARAVRELGQGWPVRSTIMANGDARRALTQADLLVAVDTAAIPTVWRLAHGKHQVPGVLGVPAAIWWLDHRTAQVMPPPDG